MKTFLVLISLALNLAVCAAQDVANVVTAHAPHYPPIALAEGAAEDIEVRAVVNERGEVIEAKALSGVNIFLKRESEKTASKWVFSKSDSARREFTLHFDYVVLYPPKNTGPDIEFSPLFKVTIRQHQPETSGPSRGAKPTANSESQSDPARGTLSHESGHVADPPKQS
jgi:hypothetical protein